MSDVSWHTLQAQARKILHDALLQPEAAKPDAVKTALEIMKLPQAERKIPDGSDT